ncbi:4-hydroxythreonine-4-phosphate dehydrogenase PdxA [Alphaproteobacteria bacterium]|nr:4-hydroxythreonine-4-phosphate dehydrogenase PdxA [Alphaproteobacteria bacterium]
MSNINNLPLCITLGDPLGIGPEITVRTLDFLQKKKININFIVIGSKKAFHKACENLNINKKLIHIKEFIDYDEKIEFLNKPSIVGGSISYKSICKAANLYKNKMVKAIVTGPISKESLHLAGHKFDGHTGLLGSLFNIDEPYLMLANKTFSTLHVTCHKSLLEAIKLITKEKIVEVISIGHDHMLKINKTEPRIAVCGLNPHAGENGIFGSEEVNEIIPAVELLKKKGLNIVGPISPDIIFREAVKKKFDLVIANYHDQGHIPVKLLYFDQSVNVTLGVPFIRTSVDHGTAFDIAYKNKASAKNMLNAIFYALKMSNFQ